MDERTSFLYFSSPLGANVIFFWLRNRMLIDTSSDTRADGNEVKIIQTRALDLWHAHQPALATGLDAVSDKDLRLVLSNLQFTILI